MAVVTMKSLLESGVHFGHQVRRWDPRMKKYIFAQRNGIHIIDLQKTVVAIKEAFEVIRHTVLAGNSVLFVGTKKQAQVSVQREAERCDMFYVNNRWLGGMLTNFSTIKKSLVRLKKIDKMEVDGTFEQLTKKEVARLLKEKGRLEKNLGGIKNMNSLPGVIFVIDTHKEAIAVAEAHRMKIPIIAVVDTNCNPEGIDYPIPGNDDAIRAINLFTQVIANAVVEADNEQGLKVIETLQEEDEGAADVAIDEEISGAESLSASDEKLASATAEETAITKDVIADAPADEKLVNTETAAKESASEEQTIDKPPAKKTAAKKPAREKEASKKSAVDGVDTDKSSAKKPAKKTTAKKSPKDESKQGKVSSKVVTPQEVKKLRDRTGAGMLDCKNALIESNADLAAAEKLLKEQGLASAEKRMGRATMNGAVFSLITEGKAAMAELCCETDFVAKNELFRTTGKEIVHSVADSGSAKKTARLERMVKEGIAILKENMTLGKVIFWTVDANDVVVNYSHNDGQIGVLVKLVCDSQVTANKEEVKNLASNLALHVAAFNPSYRSRKDVDSAYLKEQEEIFTTQAKNLSDKPEEVIKGIVQGKLNKHLAQICFVDQGFVKEDKKSVAQVVTEITKAVGGTIEIADFAYIAVGQDDQ